VSCARLSEYFLADEEYWNTGEGAANAVEGQNYEGRAKAEASERAKDPGKKKWIEWRKPCAWACRPKKGICKPMAGGEGMSNSPSFVSKIPMLSGRINTILGHTSADNQTQGHCQHEDDLQLLLRPTDSRPKILFLYCVLEFLGDVEGFWGLSCQGPPLRGGFLFCPGETESSKDSRAM